jgi:hypothetical protein
LTAELSTADDEPLEAAVYLGPEFPCEDLRDLAKILDAIYDQLSVAASPLPLASNRLRGLTLRGFLARSDLAG